MLINVNDSLTCVLNVMNLSDHYFHETGSRHFGHASLQSDWDFFTEDSPEARKFLENLGFKEVPGGYLTTRDQTDDPTIATVYHHPRANVHVQLIWDMDLKIKAQEVIEKNKLIRYNMTKFQKADVWKTVIRTLQSMS